MGLRIIVNRWQFCAVLGKRMGGLRNKIAGDELRERESILTERPASI